MSTITTTISLPGKHTRSVQIAVAEYDDGHHVCEASKSVCKEGPLVLALQDQYPEHFIYSQDQGDTWRVDLYPNGQKPCQESPSESATILLEIPHYLRVEIFAALSNHVSHLESQGESAQDFSGNSLEKVGQRKHGDSLLLNAHRIRDIAGYLMTLPEGYDDTSRDI